MPKPFVVPVNCPVCAKPMTVRIQLPRQFEAGAEPVAQPIRCPYDGCPGQLTPAIHGQIIAVWKGHDPDAGQS